ncbi:PEPxxWA-CTERM sorting domain-containing protein [Sphingomonas humi]
MPEPGSWALMLIGFGGIGMIMRRRRLRSSLVLPALCRPLEE